jgi:hypothetical protein
VRLAGIVCWAILIIDDARDAFTSDTLFSAARRDRAGVGVGEGRYYTGCWKIQADLHPPAADSLVYPAKQGLRAAEGWGRRRRKGRK